jgi:hypothetical protein
MKRSEELKHLLRQRAFHLFRVHLTDGRTFDIEYPDMNLVGETFFVIGIPEPNVPDPFGDDWELVEMSDIQRVDTDVAPDFVVNLP